MFSGSKGTYSFPLNYMKYVESPLRILILSCQISLLTTIKVIGKTEYGYVLFHLDDNHKNIRVTVLSYVAFTVHFSFRCRSVVRICVVHKATGIFFLNCLFMMYYLIHVILHILTYRNKYGRKERFFMFLGRGS